MYPFIYHFNKISGNNKNVLNKVFIFKMSLEIYFLNLNIIQKFPKVYLPFHY